MDYNFDYNFDSIKNITIIINNITKFSLNYNNLIFLNFLK